MTTVQARDAILIRVDASDLIRHSISNFTAALIATPLRTSDVSRLPLLSFAPSSSTLRLSLVFIDPFHSLPLLFLFANTMEADEQSYEVSPIMDAFDIDLVVKVLNHTAFSTWNTHRTYEPS